MWPRPSSGVLSDCSRSLDLLERFHAPGADSFRLAHQLLGSLLDHVPVGLWQMLGQRMMEQQVRPWLFD